MSIGDSAQQKEAERKSKFQEIGSMGRSSWGPVVAYVESEAKYRGLQGARTFSEIRRGDHIGAAMFSALTLPIKSVNWWAEPSSENEPDRKAANYLWNTLTNIPQLSFGDLITDICSMFAFGWSYHEMVMGRNEAGEVGFQNVAMRPQLTLSQWEYDDNGDIFGMWQMSGEGMPVLIPLDRSLHMRTDREADDPEGLSIYRPGVRLLKYRQRLEQVEGVGYFRQHAGFPLVTLPENATTIRQEADDSDEYKANRLVKAIYLDRMQGAVIPETWGLTFGGPQGGQARTGLGDAITRKNAEMMLSILVQWLMLGLTSIGSQALAGTLLDFFMASAEAFLDIIEGVFNRKLVPYLFGWYVDPGLSGLPAMRHSSPKPTDLKALAVFLRALGAVDGLTMDMRTEDFLRQLIPGMPPVADQSGRGSNEGGVVQDGDEGDGEGDDEGAQMRRGLGAAHFTKSAPADRLGAYQTLADENATAQRANVERWTGSMAMGIAALDADITPGELGAALDDWVMTGLLMFRERSALDIGAAFWLGFGSPSGPPGAQAALDAEIAQADRWLGYAPDGGLARTNPAGQGTLFGDIAGTLEGRIGAILLLLKTGKTNEVALEVTQAVREATQGFSRPGKYSGHVWRSCWVGAHEGTDNPLEAVRWTLDPLARHCSECPLFAGDYVSWDALMAVTGGILPGFGTECDGGCRCKLWAFRGGTWVIM